MIFAINAKPNEIKIEKIKVKKDKVKKVKSKISKPGDRDNDGILDSEDKCPDVFGVKKLKGCSENDLDGDGVINEKDNCPNLAGDTRFGGCLDTDNDGISDFNDKCPDVKGSHTLAGCPDTDNDGIPDYNDSCVLIPGTEELSGCPDRDNDGIGDKIDKCPDEYGLIELDGCPKATLVPTKLKALILVSKKIIQFEDGNTILKPTSFSILNQIAVELKVNTSLKISIHCHTDNNGSEIKNLALSDKRAKELAKYFIKKGIDTSRVSSEGFGGLKPIADNTTEKGRAMNRRIDLIIN
jgi:outer membrane protein OmpA-like peptidoglycan-associated protein